MTVELLIHELDFPDKLKLLETLWEDLGKSPEKLVSPDWYKEALDERRQRLQAGEETVLDWEVAKQEIRRRAS